MPDNQKKVFSYMKGKVARVNAKITEGPEKVFPGKNLAGFSTQKLRDKIVSKIWEM